MKKDVIILPEMEKKGVTVKIDAALHAEARKYLEENNMTMAEFVSLAMDNKLHSIKQRWREK